MNRLVLSSSNNSSERNSVAEKVMQLVQSCPWSSFKLHEIVTLEKCLKEVSQEDPMVAHILKKIANEAVFIEPLRKKKHLSRKNEDQQLDAKYIKMTASLREQTAAIRKEIEHYKKLWFELVGGEDETKSRISQLKRSIVQMENAQDVWRNDFELVLEQVTSSLERSIDTLTRIIPDFLNSLQESELISSSVNIGSLHRRFLIKLVKDGAVYEQQPKRAISLSISTKRHMIQVLESYLGSIVKLYKDLVLIDKVYSTEVAEEIEHLNTVKAHIDYLKQPFREAPRRFLVVQDYENVSNGLNIPEVIMKPLEEMKDSELDQLLAVLNDKLKSVRIGGEGSRET